MLKDDATTTFRESFQGHVNNSHEVITAQIRSNLRRQLPQLDRYPPNDYKVALLCGGPSLVEFRKPRGYKIATVNGTYNWALDQGYVPSAYAMLDSRQFNARFVSQPISSCKYLLCCQTHPDVFDALADYDVRLWHSVSEKDQPLLDRFYLKRWHRVPGGSTIGLRMISLLYMLGVRTIKVYGMDCSYADSQHHAYEQAENDKETQIEVKVGRRKFRSSMWMTAQMDEMFQMAPHFPDDLNISFEGEGLLQYVMQETHKRGKIPRIIMGT